VICRAGTDSGSAAKALSFLSGSTADAKDRQAADCDQGGDANGGNATIILGAPRSGTTWLAKIFDSHPDVLYRHEPDIVLRRTGIPGWVLRSEVHLHRTAARAYLRRLSGIRTLKSAGSLPVFPKNFRSFPDHLARLLLIYGLRGAQVLPRLRNLVRRLPIPDLLRSGEATPAHLVIKSVGACGRACLVADTVPNGRLILILRNPCGQVASTMRGYALRKFEVPFVIDDLLQTEQANRHGLTASRLQAMTAVERFAWRWVLLNEKALEDLQGLGNARVVRYEDLAADPVGTARKLFAFAGLDWHSQTEAFIRRSTTHSSPSRYFQVFQDTPAVVGRWRTELTHQDIVRIAGIVRSTRLWQFFPELHEFVGGQEYAAD